MPDTTVVKAAWEIALVTNVTAITVTTIKRNFVGQMYRLGRKEFLKRMKEGTIKLVGMARGLKDLPDMLILQRFDDEKLVTYADINYREYLSHIGHFDLDLKGDELGNFIEFEISKVPQLFTT